MTVGRAAVVMLVTGSDRDGLARLGRTLLEERLIACLTVLPGATSIYRWEGEIREDTEALGVLKTTAAAAAEVTRRISELHTYEVPEILVLPVEGGSSAYLDWVGSQVRT